MKVKCFGIARDIIASEQVEVLENNPITCVADLREWINSHYPAMQNLNGFMIAINQEYADDDQLIESKDEIAIIPPVSGG